MKDVSRLIGLGALAASTWATAGSGLVYAQVAAEQQAPAAQAPAPMGEPPVAQALPSQIARILVEGNQRIEAETIRSYLLIQPGDAFDPERIDLSLKTLFQTNLFADVQFQQRGADLVVRVVENPIVNQVLFEGNSALATDKLEPEVQAKPRSVFTQARAQQDVARILELYTRSGRFAATVTPKVKELPQNRVDLIFEINEGPTTGIRAINFIGNRVFSDRVLREKMVTKESSIFRILSSNTNYDPDRLEFDREQLRKFYTNEGYADFRIVSAVAELTPDQKDFFLTITVEEGEKYTFGDVKVTTRLSKLSGDDLRAFVPIRTGQEYRSDLLESAEESLVFASGSAGYAFVDVRPRITANKDTRTIDINFEVNEGPRVYIDRIDIIGNTRTVDEVIRREIRLVEGDAFNRVLIDRSKNRIQALGFFKEVEVTEKPSNLPDRTVVEVQVEEQPTGELAFSVGYSSQDAYVFDISVTERNLRGRGQFLRFRVGASARTQNVDIRFTEPRFLGRNIAAGGDIFSVRQDFIEEASFITQSTGASVRAGFPITEYMSLGTRYTIRTDNVEVDPAQCFGVDQLAICRSAGDFITSVAGYTFNWDRRNNPVKPTRGFDFSISQDLAGLGGEVKYLKTEASAGVYYGIIPNVVASLQLSAGYIAGWDNDVVRINDRFFKGGQSFRGFQTAGIGPRQVLYDSTGTTVTEKGDALGGNAYAIGSLELTFPTGLPESYGVSGALFADFGTVGLVDDVDKTFQVFNGLPLVTRDGLSLRASAGLSVFWDSPFGPIRLDFSQPFLKEPYDRTETFRFSQVQRF